MSMDKIIHSALEEICSQGVNGISISHLWPRLQSSLSSAGLPLCRAVKRAVWSGLVAVPGLQFQTQGSDFDPKSKSFEECEGLELKVFANEQLRRCFVGLNDVKASNITPPQQRVLERLALARGNGVTQNQLCKELGIPANNFFYVVKRLESWGLVVRQSTIVRMKETSSDKEQKGCSPVHTNLIHLRRYALPLGLQQRLEIIKENKNLDESCGDDEAGGDSILRLSECGQDDVHVNDFLPALKAICDRLEQAEGKVLVVSDIKQELGYREKKGHRVWRNMCNRLKQAGLVEVFDAKVDKKLEATTISRTSKSRARSKPVSCLRLLKKFSPKIFEQKASGCEYDNPVTEQTAISGNRIQNTDQLVELPLEQQIFDMIDAEGSKGLFGIEVCRRLGISNKMLDNLSSSMVPRFRLHQVSENCKRGSAYRFWTHGNFNPELPNSSHNSSNDGPEECGPALSPYRESSYCENLKRTGLGSVPSEKWITGENTTSGDAEQQRKDVSQEHRGSSEMVVWSNDSQDLSNDMSITVHASESAAKVNQTLVEVSSCTVPKALNLQQGQRYPSLTSTQRELRVLERLKTEKILLRPELQRWLENCEKDKQTRMDRKTLQRCLKKLEQEGHCKLIDFSIPGVTNCGRHRDTVVVLHPSFEGSARELSDKVHDRWRLFEMQIRGTLSQSKNELPVPVLQGIDRIQKNSSSDVPNVKSEAMRTNGFVLAKMVRTKLLHNFLWGYVTGLAKCNDASSWSAHITSRNPHSSCLLFGLDAAIKAMSLELFLQVVGSALKFEDVIEKCKTGVLLSDLPEEEYKSLMDTRATGRLSWLIDILRRLKLIRLVTDESPNATTKISHATLTYALELKPYLEEPPLINPLPGGSGSRDLRPHLRHDFILSTSKAVDRYWQTLEYCYAAADPKAALLAFPGSVVHEVCLCRSWTTVRVMTAEQRSKLLKRIKDQSSKKLTFQECREIAKDLKLTLDQVLRVYYDNRQRCLNRSRRDVDIQDADADGLPRSRRKRKTSSEGRFTKQAKVNHTPESLEDNQAENMEEPEVSGQQEPEESLIDDCIMPMLKQPRQPKFSWTKEADRQLIIQYARQRAKQGAKRGTDWASIGDLPAPPRTCRRRMAVLNLDNNFRKSLMRLCNLLTQRYARQLDNERNLINRSDCGQDSDSHGEHWDDFDNFKIQTALNEVLLRKQMIKLDTSKKTGSETEGTHNSMSNTPCNLEVSDRQQTDSSRRSRIHRLPQNFVKHLQEGVSFTRRVNQSLAISNAVELFKLVFLTTSKATETPSLLAETLRCYSEHDLYSAFDYLREKKIMVGCGTSQPFVLSQHFLRNLSMSQFPSNTGKQAAKLAGWIYEKGKELMEEVVTLPSDLQCGAIYHLFGLVSSGELSISPLLPDDGVGEAEDSRSSKRKSDDHEFDDYGLNKKLKFHSLQECEIFSRREKGFPGITVSLSRASITRSNIAEFFKDEDRNHLLSEYDSFYASLGQKASCMLPTVDHIEEPPEFSSIVPATVIYGDSLWEVMANYTLQHMLKHSEVKHCQVHSELIKTAYATIQKAGDQGLSMSKISESTGLQGTILAEQVIDVLQLFGLVVKVNSYDSVHVVDSLFRTKYFLTSKATHCQDPERSPSSILQTVNKEIIVDGVENSEHKMNCANRDGEHKVTILNLSQDVSRHSNAIDAHDETINGERRENQNFEVSAAAFQPILPWINGDGTINEIVYRGLTRRILGIVTLNPGILEDAILSQMEVLNPQSCRRLLELMVLDKHLIVRKMTQSTSSGPPALLKSLIGSHMKIPKFICREHYFANPMSSTLL